VKPTGHAGGPTAIMPIVRNRDVGRWPLAALALAYFGEIPQAAAAWGGLRLDSMLSVSSRGLFHGCVGDLSMWHGISPGLDEVGAPCGGSLAFDFGALALIFATVVVVVRMRLRAEEQRLDLARRYLEQGREPPLSLFPSAARSDLRRGVILIAAGLGFLVAGGVSGEFAAAGLIPGFVGIGYLVSFGLARRMAGQGRG